jgi:hypothetical protein
MKSSAQPQPKRRLFARPPEAKRPAPAPQPKAFNAFIAYADLAAAKRAMNAIDEVLRATAGKFALKPMLWRFDQLITAKWCDYALSDASAADVIVLANTSPGPLQPAVEEWVSALLARRRGRRITIVSLQGEDDAWTISIEAPAAPPATQLRALPDMPRPIHKAPAAVAA